MKVLIGLVAVVTLLAGLEPPAHAEGKTATSFALIVTSNRSARLSRPDLRYADDDGAKYYEMFRMVAPEANVRLLTTFDADSEKLFPDVVSKAHAPTAAAVKGAAAELASLAEAAKARGPVDFYFVFAGHGDIQGGKGFLDLPDGAFTADDLEAMLRSVPATHAHVILDSCNSFFVVNSRKPGGRHFVTAEEASRSLSDRLPNVGVFLSTSAEAEVFEWSELQSGVFSHAVRSGLSGAADVDHDGAVSYDELKAFVNVASKEVKNPLYRPQVFARGPGGKGKLSILDLTAAQGTRVRLDERQHRVTVRDANELPWFDFHKESGEVATLVLPARVAAGASIDEHGAIGRVRHVLEAPAPADLALAQLAASPAPRDARGGDELFRSFFARPFGPQAFAAASVEDPAQQELVLGLSSDERERMRLLLNESADAARRARLVRGPLTLTLTAGIGGAGGALLAAGVRYDSTGTAVAGGVAAAVGGYLFVRSLIGMVSPTTAEETLQAFVRDSANESTAQHAYALAERRLLWAASEDARRRAASRWIGAAAFAIEGAGLAFTLASSSDTWRRQSLDRSGAIILTGTGTMLGGVLFVDSLFPSTTERMAELWKRDPSRIHAAPLMLRPQIGFGSAGLSGTW